MKRWLFSACLCVTALAWGETWQFALIGDVPYSARERRELPLMLDAIADSNVAFIAHIGDIKHGQARCDDEVFTDRQQLFNASRAPFVFVPGDNEWSDCNRVSNGAYDPLERLAFLRWLFWQRPDSLGRKTIPLERQPGAYPEHSRFRLGPVLFVTLNLPGPDNNFGWQDEASAEFRERNPAVLQWLKGSFALARREKLAGIVLLFQADPGFQALCARHAAPRISGIPGNRAPGNAGFSRSGRARPRRYAHQPDRSPFARQQPETNRQPCPRRDLRLPADGLDARDHRH